MIQDIQPRRLDVATQIVTVVCQAVDNATEGVLFNVITDREWQAAEEHARRDVDRVLRGELTVTPIGVHLHEIESSRDLPGLAGIIPYTRRSEDS